MISHSTFSAEKQVVFGEPPHKMKFHPSGQNSAVIWAENAVDSMYMGGEDFILWMRDDCSGKPAGSLLIIKRANSWFPRGPVREHSIFFLLFYLNLDWLIRLPGSGCKRKMTENLVGELILIFTVSQEPPTFPSHDSTPRSLYKFCRVRPTCWPALLIFYPIFAASSFYLAHFSFFSSSHQQNPIPNSTFWIRVTWLSGPGCDGLMVGPGSYLFQS